MKNRYLKNARIPERKVREVLNLFCQDLTATQIANISGISRITVNAYLKLIRTQIAQFCEEQNPWYFKRSLLPLLSGKQTVLAGDADSHPTDNQYYGIFKHENYIVTSNITHVDPVWLDNWMRGKIQVPKSTIVLYRLDMFEAIADFNRTKLHRINGEGEFTKGKSKIDEIDLFWGLLKSRIIKFRGLNTNTTYLHVKESEFRYNNRNTDLFNLVHALIQKRPLHYVRQEVVLRTG